MNHDEYDENRPMSVEERLTAYLLDELEPAEREKLEAELAADPALAERVAILSATVSLLRGGEASPALSPFRRGALRAAAETGATSEPAAAEDGATESAGAGSGTRQGGRVLRFRRVAAMTGILATAAALVLIFKLPSWTENGPTSADSRASMAVERLEKAGFQRQQDGKWAKKGYDGFSEDGSLEQIGYVGPAQDTGDALHAIGYSRTEAQDLAFRVESAERKRSIADLEELGYVSQGEAAGRTLLNELGYSGGATDAPARVEPEEGPAIAGNVNRFPYNPDLKKRDLLPSLSADADTINAISPGDSESARSGLLYRAQDPYSGYTIETAQGAAAAPRQKSQDSISRLDPGQEREQLRYTGPGDTVAPILPAAPPAAEAPVNKQAAGGGGGTFALTPDVSSEWNRWSGDDKAPDFDTQQKNRFDESKEGRAAELGAKLEELGYAGEAHMGRGLLGRDRPRGYELQDGYGRRHHGRDIIRHLHRLPKEGPRDMFFRYYGDNAFVRAAEDPLSTFAADVDTASYPLARNYVVKNMLPPKAAVRTEEFVNYFKNELAPPADGDFAIHMEYGPSLFSNEGAADLLKIGVKAREVSRENRKPLNLVFVIDKSGSMAQEHRLELVKRSLELLIDQLDEEDTVGLVTFDSDGHKVLDPTPGYERYQIREAVRGLNTGGSTNAHAGLLIGYEMAERHFQMGAVNRIILCSDGVANTGETDQEKILAEVRAFSEQQIDLTAVGVGMGNHNDVFLEQIADKGNGFCHYVDDFDEARRVFIEQFTGTLQTVARDVKIQVEFNPEWVKRWRQLGYENRSIADQDFRNDTVDAGEVGAGHEVVALYELETRGLWDGPTPPVATVRLRWFPDGATEAVEMEKTVTLADRASRFTLTGARFRLSAVAAQFAEVLRRSYWSRGDSYEQLMEQAAQVASELPDAQVKELRDMIRRAKVLIDRLPPQDELASLIDEARRTRMHEAELERLGSRTDDVEELLEQVRAQNEKLEQQIQKLLEARGM